MKKFEVFLAILCAFSLIISCVSINSVQIIQGEKGERGERGQQGMAGHNGSDGVDGKNGKDGKDGVDGKDGLTPYIKDSYWWIGDTNTGYRVGELPCYVETVEQIKEFKCANVGVIESDILNFCLNNDAYAIEVSYNSRGSFWSVPVEVALGTLYESGSTRYNKVTIKDVTETTLNIKIDEQDHLIISYSIEEFFAQKDKGGYYVNSVKIYYIERQHIIQKTGE